MHNSKSVTHPFITDITGLSLTHHQALADSPPDSVHPDFRLWVLLPVGVATGVEFNTPCLRVAFERDHSEAGVSMKSATKWLSWREHPFALLSQRFSISEFSWEPCCNLNSSSILVNRLFCMQDVLQNIQTHIGKLLIMRL